MDRIPKSLAVIGAGVIGCEYASIFMALGVDVTLVDGRDRLLPFLDNEISNRLRDRLAAPHKDDDQARHPNAAGLFEQHTTVAIGIDA